VNIQTLNRFSDVLEAIETFSGSGGFFLEVMNLDGKGIDAVVDVWDTMSLKTGRAVSGFIDKALNGESFDPAIVSDFEHERGGKRFLIMIARMEDYLSTLPVS